MRIQNTAIFLSVRDKASRLPGKTKMAFHDDYLIGHLMQRLQQSQRAEQFILTTSTHADDAWLCDCAKDHGWAAFCGSEDDKLQRYYDAAQKYGIEFIVVVDGDDILCAYECVDEILDRYAEKSYDYVVFEGLPVGVTGFGVRTSALKTILSYKKESDTEIWGSYLTENPNFKSCTIPAPAAWHRPDWRMTLDYQEDFDFFAAVFGALYQPDKKFSLNDLIQFLDHHPDITAINQKMGERYQQNLLPKLEKMRQDAHLWRQEKAS